MKLVIAIILIFTIADVMIVSYVLYHRYRKRISPATVEMIQVEWKRIIRQEDRRHSILEADKLLDYALGQMGYRGSLGAKLKNNSKLFRNINHVWAAHKIRNNIAHQINYQVDEKTYKQTMLYFKQAFKDLKIF